MSYVRVSTNKYPSIDDYYITLNIFVKLLFKKILYYLSIKYYNKI